VGTERSRQRIAPARRRIAFRSKIQAAELAANVGTHLLGRRRFQKIQARLKLSCNQCSLRTLAGNDADPVDPRQTPGWQKASVAAVGPPLLPQADRAEPSRMSAQTPITPGTLIMMWLSSHAGNLAPA
jgi:hypothetical protein